MLHVATQVAFTVASAVSLFSVIVKLYIVFRRRQQSEAAATRRSSLGGVKIAPALARVTSAKQLKAEFDRVRMEQARYLSYLLLLFLEGLSSPHPSFLHFRPAACTSAAFVRDALQISRWVRPSHRIGLLSVFLWSRVSQRRLNGIRMRSVNPSGRDGFSTLSAKLPYFYTTILVLMRSMNPSGSAEFVRACHVCLSERAHAPRVAGPFTGQTNLNS